MSAQTTTVYISRLFNPNAPFPAICNNVCGSYEDNLNTFQVNSTNCKPNTDSSQTCTFTASLPIGTEEIDVLGVNITNGVSTALEFGDASTTISLGQPNTLSVTLGAFIGGVSLTPVLSIGPYGGQQNGVNYFTFQFTDTFGNVLPSTVPLEQVALPISGVVDSDTTGQTTLTTSNAPGVAITSGDRLTINYTPNSAAQPDAFTITVYTPGFAFENAPEAYLPYDFSISPLPKPIPETHPTYQVNCSVQESYGNECTVNAPASVTIQ